MQDYGLMDGKQEKGLFSRMKSSFAPYVLGLSALAGACGGPTGPDPIGTPTPPGKVTVNGAITGRMSGESVNGCEVTYTGKNGQGVAKAVAVNGNYEIRDIPTGMYEVKIENCGNLPHVNQNFNVNGQSAPFSVIRMGSQKDGVVYDEKFDEFFNYIARNPEYSKSRVKKWTTMPTEILIDQTTFNYLSPEAQDRFLSELNEVNDESIPRMYCNRIGPLPIRVEPYSQDYKEGAILIRFQSGQSYAGRNLANDRISAATAWLNIDTHGNLSLPRWETKSGIAHELFHGTYADHAYGLGYRQSLMGGSNDVVQLSNEDRLASCIVYHDDTHPGNMAPDTNPN